MMLRGDVVFVSRKEGVRAPGFVISPRLAGVCVVIGVMAVPNVPAAYLTPVAVFLGAVSVFLLEGRRYRQNGHELQETGRELQGLHSGPKGSDMQGLKKKPEKRD